MLTKLKMFTKLKTEHPNKYPINMGNKWEKDEDNILLEELKKNTDIKSIADNHQRTIGSIKSRIKLIAYNMYMQNIQMREIINITKLNEEVIRDIINKKKKKKNKVSLDINTQSFNEHNTDITEIKKEISELKNMISGLVDMMNAVYDFEDS